MNPRIKELVEQERQELEDLEEEHDLLKGKWVKFSTHYELIEFINYFIELKKVINKRLDKRLKELENGK